MPVPQAALDHEADQLRLTGVAVAAVVRIWRRMKGRNSWENTWRDEIGPQITATVEAAQAASAARSSQYIAEVLVEQGVPSRADTTLLPSLFAGVDGGGYPIESSTYGAVLTAVEAQYKPDATTDSALAEAEAYIEGVVAAIMADTARAAEAAATAQRPWVTGYIRMIEPGACSRCAVLAGKFYLTNAGFDRHPRCKCIHVPAAEDIPHDPRTNPSAYFNSLSRAQQDQVFTIAGAEAIRLGADISQVVNARRGMTTAQQNPRGWIPKGRLIPVDVYGNPTYITTEGTTKYGLGRKAMGSGRPVRLMPESILMLAQSPEDAIRLLKLYGYLI